MIPLTNKIELTISRAEAIVIFDWLDKMGKEQSEIESTANCDDSEQRAFWGWKPRWKKYWLSRSRIIIRKPSMRRGIIC